MRKLQLRCIFELPCIRRKLQAACSVGKKKMLIIGIVTVAATVLFASYVPYRMSKYPNIIKLNWALELPLNYSELYSEDSGPGFHGDGIRYHIFQYQNTEKTDTLLSWSEEGQSRIGKSFRITAQGWLDELNVPTEFRPNYDNCVYYYAIQNDCSEIIIFYEAETCRLYVLEQFL